MEIFVSQINVACYRVGIFVNLRRRMKKLPLTVQSSLYRLRGWSKRLAPYVARTITLKRPIANYKLRRSTACNGIDEYLLLDINGHQQWLRIRGERDSNPVILYLHGGPGGSQIPFYRHYQLGWEQDFTVVYWEQRGAGKSYSPRLDIARHVNQPHLVA